jgi:histone demethylase JARID1
MPRNKVDIPGDDDFSRTKRRRKATSHFDFASLDNGEEKIYQQALKNSTIDHYKLDLEIREGPTYYPSTEEFKDPLKYIRSISTEAAQYGICKIVPPKEWNPPCQVSLDDPRRFPTKRQEINVLQQGKGFDEGKVYNIAEYKAMADSFYDKWMETFYGQSAPAAVKMEDGSNAKSSSGSTSSSQQQASSEDKTIDKGFSTSAPDRAGSQPTSSAASNGVASAVKEEMGEVDPPRQLAPSSSSSSSSSPSVADDSASLADTTGGKSTPGMRGSLAKDYWEMVSGGSGIRKRAIVDYANDIDTTKYTSGFPLKHINTNGSVPLEAINIEDVQGEPALTAEEVVAANAASLAQAKREEEKGNTPLVSAEKRGMESEDCADMYSNAYYRRTGWNLVNLASSNGSVLQHLHTSINGINVPWLYIGMLFSSFCWHNEDNYLYSINYHHFGECKQWYGVPGHQAKAFEKVSKNFLLESFKESPDLLHHMTTQISPELLVKNNIAVCKAVQTPRTFIVTFPKAFHAGFSYGFNVGEAVNFATPDWLKQGTEADERYRMFARNSVFSHQRLLFTLLYHTTPLMKHLSQDKYTLDHRELSKLMCDGDIRGMQYHISLLVEVKKVIQEELLARPAIIQKGVRDTSGLIKMPPNNFTCIDDISSNYDDLRSCHACKHICLLTAVACECDRNIVSCTRHFNLTCKCPTEKRYMLGWMPIEELTNLGDRVHSLHNILERKVAEVQAKLGGY